MNKHFTVTLDDHSADFVDRLVKQGRFESISDVIRAGLQLLDERQKQIERLRAAIIEGEESGPSQPFNLDEFLAQMHGERASKAIKS